MEQKKEKKYLIGSILCGLLTAIGIAAIVISLIGADSALWFLGDFVQLVLLLMVIYYAFAGYKKPHGNLLKYIILIHSAWVLTGIIAYVSIGDVKGVVLLSIEIGLTCYIAGRLAKAKENLILMIIVTICLTTVLASDIIAGIADIDVIAPLITWLDICVAYFLRYKQHRAAGLEDAPKK